MNFPKPRKCWLLGVPMHVCTHRCTRHAHTTHVHMKGLCTLRPLYHKMHIWMFNMLKLVSLDLCGLLVWCLWRYAIRSSRCWNRSWHEHSFGHFLHVFKSCSCLVAGSALATMSISLQYYHYFIENKMSHVDSFIWPNLNLSWDLACVSSLKHATASSDIQTHDNSSQCSANCQPPPNGSHQGLHAEPGKHSLHILMSRLVEPDDVLVYSKQDSRDNKDTWDSDDRGIHSWQENSQWSKTDGPE